MKKNKVRLLTLIMSTLFIINGLVGCSSSEKKEEINILNYGANAAEGVYEEFEKETGIKVNEKTFDDMHYMYQEVASGKVKYDVILVSDDMAEKMIKEDMLQNINKDNIPNIVNMNEGDMGKPYDPNNDYTVPYMNGTIGLIYNTEVIDEDITSWKSLFDSKYKDEVLDLMKSEEKKIAMIWSGEGLNLEAEDSKFKYVIPEEGADYWLDSWAIPKDAKNVSGAEKFINFMSGKDIAFRTADEIGYTSPQKQAIEEQPSEVKNNENAYMPEEILDKCEGYKYLDEDNLRLYEDIWMQIKG